MNSDQIESRRKFVIAFNTTLLKIWKERLALLRVMDTGSLYNSVRSTHTVFDAEVLAISIGQAFKHHGLPQNYGTGRETPRGNPGDIGRAKVRQKRPWFDRKYFASVYNLRDFLGESVGRQYISVISRALNH